MIIIQSKSAAASNAGSFQNMPMSNTEPMAPEEGFMNIPDGIESTLPFN